MANKEDLRVQRTRKALNEAFMKLLSEKPFEEITINELCDAAGVRRATFYKHYADKFSFLTAYTHSLRDKFDRETQTKVTPSPDKDYYVAYAKRIVGFIHENLSAIEHVIRSDMFPFVLSAILAQNFKDTCKHLESSVKDGMPLVASIESISSMCAGGVAAVIYTWLNSENRKHPDAIAEEIGALISAVLK